MNPIDFDVNDQGFGWKKWPVSWNSVNHQIEHHEDHLYHVHTCNVYNP